MCPRCPQLYAPEPPSTSRPLRARAPCPAQSDMRRLINTTWARTCGKPLSASARACDRVPTCCCSGPLLPRVGDISIRRRVGMQLFHGGPSTSSPGRESATLTGNRRTRRMAASLSTVRRRSRWSVRRAFHLRTAHLLRMATQAALVARHGLLALGGKMARTPASMAPAVEGRHLARAPGLVSVCRACSPPARRIHAVVNEQSLDRQQRREGPTPRTLAYPHVLPNAIPVRKKHLRSPGKVSPLGD